MNIMEGGKRITRVAQCLIALGAVALFFSDEAYTHLIYEIKEPGAEWRLVPHNCPTGIEALTVSHSIEGALVNICVPTFKGRKDGPAFVHIPGANGTIETVEADSESASAYIRALTDQYPTTEAEAAGKSEARRQWWTNRLTSSWKLIVLILGAVLGIEAVARVIGWIMRGFMKPQQS